ncbi:hypothetical protein GCM10008935_24800 [Alkalibacillus silvisoli]|uniref:Uncharacterized protein n=1 Tax=Alkalibacillus silvisoli TaxID=392823 RepID=A0ABP3JZF8_9BACI
MTSYFVFFNKIFLCSELLDLKRLFSFYLKPSFLGVYLNSQLYYTKNLYLRERKLGSDVIYPQIYFCTLSNLFAIIFKND